MRRELTAKMRSLAGLNASKSGPGKPSGLDSPGLGLIHLGIYPEFPRTLDANYGEPVELVFIGLPRTLDIKLRGIL